MMKLSAVALALLPSLALAQSYPSPTFQNTTTLGNATIGGTLGVTGATTLGGALTAPFQHTTYVFPTTTLTSGFRDDIAAGGTVTSGQAFLREFAVDSDTLSAPNGAAGVYIGHTISAGAVGGRNGLQLYLSQTGATNLAVANPYYVGLGIQSQAAYSAGGVSGSPVGNLFSSNPSVQLSTGAGLYWNSLVGEEIDVQVQAGTGVRFKDGIKVVQTIGDAVAGPVGADYAISINNQAQVGSPTVGWRTGISFGGYEGWWPIQSTGTLVGTNSANIGGGPSMAAAYGVDFSGVTFSTAAFKSTGFAVDGSGNVSITPVYPGLGTMLTTYANRVNSTAAFPPFVWLHGSMGGTASSGQPFAHVFTLDADNLTSSVGGGNTYIGETITGGTGGRTALEVLLNQTGATTANGGYYAAFGAFVWMNANAGGTSGTHAGSIAASNPIAYLKTGATYFTGIEGEEVNVAIESGASADYKVGLKVVQAPNDVNSGAVGDYAIGLNNNSSGGGTRPGWTTGLTFGGPEGWWPMKSTGTMIGTLPTALGGPSYAAAYGVDLSAVTFSTGAFKSTGFLVDPTGVVTGLSYVAGSTAGVASKTCTISALGATITITGGIVTATSGC